MCGIKYFVILLYMRKNVLCGLGLYMGPYFEDSRTQNFTVREGNVAYLPCIVQQLGDKMVSWIRPRDDAIISVGPEIFVRDRRFSIHRNSNTWTLVLKSTTESDSGIYECQISTEPKMSMKFSLNVLIPRIEILGEKVKYVKIGSVSKISCKVISAVQLPDYIFWNHNGVRLSPKDDSRVSIEVYRQKSDENGDISMSSLLTIRKMKSTDKGNYTCLPSNLDEAATFLHVLDGEQPAAMQSGSLMNSSPVSTRILVCICNVLAVFDAIF